jgi:hypothetical protein
MGEPHEVLPQRWAVLGRLDGTDASSVRTALDCDSEWLATDSAKAVLAIGRPADVPALRRGGVPPSASMSSP